MGRSRTTRQGLLPTSSTDMCKAHGRLRIRQYPVPIPNRALGKNLAHPTYTYAYTADAICDELKSRDASRQTTPCSVAPKHTPACIHNRSSVMNRGLSGRRRRRYPVVTVPNWNWSIGIPDRLAENLIDLTPVQRSTLWLWHWLRSRMFWGVVCPEWSNLYIQKPCLSWLAVGT